ncbi:uncharacterized protein LOC133340243 [Lethenteron reissneri]|uniref:uncharacterized protein LOC133340243 n=1 Tax=Lethenteron reissneri TaxID=7753 RepID=UPI002AB6A47E|nr:uncharacterized protein LOC133340243 [Lethenteron reissneri]XP_061404263.1 uncharacterized protein LOC133340243 [Lethenteron reissneri]XP_061404264.1 uncharacterized protein LOC133340243 [Lethenteron reissneri]XP_061404265.1 uncharacterized protein LOC133340243 [Lethenteron reissneri]XP_061404266.1 uncharacterized protein LOC133340243 [Lethenteron reissneri]XP_061404267.1 uncharacterized protein LOC133340243 [Lethenteron reissneri]
MTSEQRLTPAPAFLNLPSGALHQDSALKAAAATWISFSSAVAAQRAQQQQQLGRAASSSPPPMLAPPPSRAGDRYGDDSRRRGDGRRDYDDDDEEDELDEDDEDRPQDLSVRGRCRATSAPSPAPPPQSRGSAGGRYECKHCHLATQDFGLFTCHVDTAHPNVVVNPVYICRACDFRTARQGAFAEHNSRHHPSLNSMRLRVIKRQDQTILEQSPARPAKGQPLSICDGDNGRSDGRRFRSAADEGDAAGAQGRAGPLECHATAQQAKAASAADSDGSQKTLAVLPAGVGLGQAVRLSDLYAPDAGLSKGALALNVTQPAAFQIFNPVLHHIVQGPQQNLQQQVALHAAASPYGGHGQQSHAVQRLSPAALGGGLGSVVSILSVVDPDPAMDANPHLATAFARFPYPSQGDVSWLASVTPFSEERIRSWFAARRVQSGISWSPEEIEEARRQLIANAIAALGAGLFGGGTAGAFGLSLGHLGAGGVLGGQPGGASAPVIAVLPSPIVIPAQAQQAQQGPQLVPHSVTYQIINQIINNNGGGGGTSCSTSTSTISNHDVGAGGIVFKRAASEQHEETGGDGEEAAGKFGAGARAALARPPSASRDCAHKPRRTPPHKRPCDGFDAGAGSPRRPSCGKGPYGTDEECRSREASKQFSAIAPKLLPVASQLSNVRAEGTDAATPAPPGAAGAWASPSDGGASPATAPPPGAGAAPLAPSSTSSSRGPEPAPGAGSASAPNLSPLLMSPLWLPVAKRSRKHKKSKEQLAQLKASFALEQHPDEAELRRIMERTGLTKSEVKKWFSDSRYHYRNLRCPGTRFFSRNLPTMCPMVYDGGAAGAAAAAGLRALRQDDFVTAHPSLSIVDSLNWAARAQEHLKLLQEEEEDRAAMAAASAAATAAATAAGASASREPFVGEANREPEAGRIDAGAEGQLARLGGAAEAADNPGPAPVSVVAGAAAHEAARPNGSDAAPCRHDVGADAGAHCATWRGGGGARIDTRAPPDGPEGPSCSRVDAGAGAGEGDRERDRCRASEPGGGSKQHGVKRAAGPVAEPAPHGAVPRVYFGGFENGTKKKFRISATSDYKAGLNSYCNKVRIRLERKESPAPRTPDDPAAPSPLDAKPPTLAATAAVSANAAGPSPSKRRYQQQKVKLLKLKKGAGRGKKPYSRPKKTKEQLSVLKSFFRVTQWPSSDEYLELSLRSGLPRSDIVRWFGDTRFAFKHGQLRWIRDPMQHAEGAGPGGDAPAGAPGPGVGRGGRGRRGGGPRSRGGHGGRGGRGRGCRRRRGVRGGKAAGGRGARAEFVGRRHLQMQQHQQQLEQQQERAFAVAQQEAEPRPGVGREPLPDRREGDAPGPTRGRFRRFQRRGRPSLRRSRERTVLRAAIEVPEVVQVAEVAEVAEVACAPRPRQGRRLRRRRGRTPRAVLRGTRRRRRPRRRHRRRRGPPRPPVARRRGGRPREQAAGAGRGGRDQGADGAGAERGARARRRRGAARPCGGRRRRRRGRRRVPLPGRTAERPARLRPLKTGGGPAAAPSRGGRRVYIRGFACPLERARSLDLGTLDPEPATRRQRRDGGRGAGRGWGGRAAFGGGGRRHLAEEPPHSLPTRSASACCHRNASRVQFSS